MIPARLLLHVAAFLASTVAVYGAIVAFGLRTPEVAGFIVPAIVAAQVAALVGWPLLERFHASPWIAPLLVGLLMALVTHLLFGPFALVATQFTEDYPPGADSIPEAFMLSFFSAVIVGAATAPVTMAIAVLVHRLRRRERAEVAA